MVNGMTVVCEWSQFVAKAIIALALVVGGLWFYAKQCVYITDANDASLRRQVDPFQSTASSARTHFDDLY